MKKLQASVCILGLCAAILSPPPTKAAFVNFIEGPNESDNTAVTYSTTGVFGDWSLVFGVTTTGLPEDATFRGYILSSAPGTGKYAVGLREPGSGQLSDWVTIDWRQIFGGGAGTITEFTMVFKSDTDGQPLLLPAGYTLGQTRVEDGTLQVFRIPGISGLPVLDIGIQSGGAVPEPSTYLAGALLLLPLAFGAFRRLRKSRTA